MLIQLRLVLRGNTAGVLRILRFALFLKACFLLQNSLILRQLNLVYWEKHVVCGLGVLQNSVSFAFVGEVGVAK